MKITAAPKSLLTALSLSVFVLALPFEDTNEIPGISGMAPIDGSSYLMVLDTKAHKKGNRVGVLEILGDGTNSYSSLKVKSLDKGDDRASDLEAIHRIPGRDGEYLAAESGRRANGPGRLFHLALNKEENGVSVLASWPLAERVADAMAWDLGDGDNYEGLACWPLADGRIQLVLGERGGSDSHPRGALITGVLDLGKGEVLWLPASSDLTPKAPGKWIDPKGQRDIADLWYDDRDSSIWCAASEDPGDIGPFRSVIWRVATVGDVNAETGLRELEVPETSKCEYITDGHKIEALSAAPSVIPDAFLSFGAEDEDFGGTWRSLYPPVE